jgi:hypothetical protein
MTVTNLPARRTVAAVAVRVEEAPKPKPVTTYRLVNPWRGALLAACGVAGSAVIGATAIARLAPEHIEPAAGAGVASLALLVAASGMHTRFENRARSRSNFVPNKP